MAVAAPPAEASNGELIRWAFDALNARDVSALKQFWTDETAERFRGDRVATAPLFPKMRPRRETLS